MAKVHDYVTRGEEALDEFLGAIDGFDGSRWEEPEADGQWSMKQLLSHFAANTAGHVVEIKAILGEGPAFDRANRPWAADLQAAMDNGFDSTVDWMKASHAASIDYLRALQDDVLGREAMTGHGPQSVESLLRHFGEHGRIHAEQAGKIRAALGAQIA